MNFNLPYILQNGMKILNIVNKTLPLVKEFNPALNFIQKKLKYVAPANPSSNKNTLSTSVPRVNNKIANQNNTLTFFR